MVDPTPPPSHDTGTDDASTHAHRQLIGYLGLLLAPMLVFFASVRAMPELSGWPPLGSVSAYYYSSGIVPFVGVLTALSVFLISYRGYRNKHQWKDRLLAIIAGFAALGVAVFPTAAPGPLYVLPWWTPMLRTLHYLSAGVLFTSFILFSVWLFPKSGERSFKAMPADKKARNVIFYVCGAVMVLAIGWIGWSAAHHQSIFWAESLALTAFAVSWLTKGRALKSLAYGVRRVSGREK